MNANFDACEEEQPAAPSVKKQTPQMQQHTIERADSPLGLSSENSISFTDNLIAQKFNIAPNDPILHCFLNDENHEEKGDLIKNFFESTPLHNRGRIQAGGAPKRAKRF